MKESCYNCAECAACGSRLLARAEAAESESVALRKQVATLREALGYAHQMACERGSGDLQVHLFDRLGLIGEHAQEALAATEPPKET